VTTLISKPKKISLEKNSYWLQSVQWNEGVVWLTNEIPRLTSFRGDDRLGCLLTVVQSVASS